MTNLLTGDNSAFATSLGTWKQVQNSGRFTLAHSSSEGGMMQWDVTNGGVAMAVYTAANSDPNTMRIPVTPGAVYTLSCRARWLLGANRAFRLLASYYDSAGSPTSPTSEFTATGMDVTMTSSWQTFSGNVTAPASAAFMAPGIRVPGASTVTGDRYQFDDVTVDSGTTSLGDTRAYLLTSGGPVLLREDVLA